MVTIVSKVIYECEIVEDDESTEVNLDFEIKNGEQTTKFSYGGVTFREKDIRRWVKLITAAEKADGRFEMYFMRCNGDRGIKVHDGTVEFVMSRGGDECPIDCSITVPAKICVKIFENIFGELRRLSLVVTE